MLKSSLKILQSLLSMSLSAFLDQCWLPCSKRSEAGPFAEALAGMAAGLAESVVSSVSSQANLIFRSCFSCRVCFESDSPKYFARMSDFSASVKEPCDVACSGFAALSAGASKGGASLRASRCSFDKNTGLSLSLFISQQRRRAGITRRT